MTDTQHIATIKDNEKEIFSLELYVNGKQRGSSLRMNLTEAVKLARQKMTEKSQITGENCEFLPYSDIRVVNERSWVVQFTIDDVLHPQGNFHHSIYNTVTPL